MKALEFLPLGSIVVLKGVVKKIMIIQRAVQVKQEDSSTKYFDYGAALYPEGLVDDKIVYFNHDEIAKTIYPGYQDGDDKLMQEQINEALKTLDDDGNIDPFAEVRENEDEEAR
ncbi:DUF4176 domain-containing protein [Companilactobacillus sp. DQM5]|uniref:DUF4176 domain-containing protein n=1 Tax=Companilactobacillus sp. DQM5 TaxID=3463359 RepID=UPI00405898FD